MAPRSNSAGPALWDAVVRLTHWGVAVVVIGNALLNQAGGTWHLALGWIGAGLLGLRLVWGLIGPAEARFAAFPPNPAAALRHLAELLTGRPRDYPSHNPAGAMMVYALWLSLAVVIGTGLVMTRAETPWAVAAREEVLLSGDWSQLVTDEGTEAGEGEEGGEGTLKEVHEVFANLMLAMALLHVLGVVVESRALRRNLVLPMIGGQRQEP